MNYTSTEEDTEKKIDNFAEFIKKYALVPSHEYKIQHIALQSLQIMVKNFNIRIFLLNFFNYEVGLSKAVLLSSLCYIRGILF